MQFFHADVAYLQFFSKSAVDPKYALVCVDLFSSKIYVYTMKKKSNLAQKMELFYKEIEQKRNQKEKMRLQVDLEFQQNEIKKLNENKTLKCSVQETRGEKAFAAKQKIREFKKFLFRSKRLHKSTKTIRFDAKKLIRNAVQNMNNTNSQNYELALNAIEKKSLENEDFREINDFHRMVKVSKSAERYSRNDERLDKTSRKKLRSPLTVGKKVLVLAERLRKKDVPSNLYKSTTKNTPFFNRNELFIVRKVVPVDNTYYYWISKTGDSKLINNKFLRRIICNKKSIRRINYGTDFYLQQRPSISR